MNEETLIYAYRALYQQKPASRTNELSEADAIAEAELRLEASGYVRCQVGSCPTQIALYAQRFVCRYHERKLRESRKKSQSR